MGDTNKGSQGILEGLKQSAQMGKSLASKESKNIDSKELNNSNSKELKNLDSEEVIKRSYALKSSTIKKLQELKVFVYADPNITYNEIVDDAIIQFYDSKKKEI